ncbi:hypothetical protein ACJIZ3_008082 [Penstemon smallii]|uniref:Uncharacterized protein n=1 Tax=Penstemon smallii TaxID=265156 RepID=A0ABD3T8R6_9LAMI
MYNQNQEHHKSSAPPPMSPRISFSNDFVESSQYSHNSHSTLSQFKPNSSAAYRDAPVSSDFEFSVNNYSMMSADELFSKGRLLPFKESIIKNNTNNNSSKTTTLRDELQNGDDNFSLRPPKNPTRWRGFLGLRKSHIGSKKIDKGEGSRQPFPHDDNKNPQDSVND